MTATIIITVLLVALDQATKYLATTYLQPMGTMPFLPGVMELRYVLNDGAAFSMFSGGRWILVSVTSVVLVAIAIYLLLRKPSSKLEYTAWLLVLAGGVGNLIDRVLHGVVVDFFATTFVRFAVFNVADCYVTVGVVLLLLSFLLPEILRKKAKPDDAA